MSATSVRVHPVERDLLRVNALKDAEETDVEVLRSVAGHALVERPDARLGVDMAHRGGLREAHEGEDRADAQNLLEALKDSGLVMGP